MSVTMQKYGELVFNETVMKTRLSQNAYTQLMEIITKENPLDKEIAGEIAHSIKEWAIENGATHFAHWFQPIREGTAEKHYAFISYNEAGELIERLTADQLIQSEPDASSFPSGGIRSTFEARGYTAWDPTSPVFLMEGKTSKTLVIPSVFLSWTGDVLDQKTALLRSKKALNQAGMKIQKLLGNRNAKRIQVWLGIEQEYFLLPKALVENRMDLRICGKTLFGNPAIRGQQMKDHYFGAIKQSVLQFMEDFDQELYRRGIPAKTRHNEVSPNQFEITPLHEEANLALDHNLQLMTLLKDVADRHGFVSLLHEKPFDGVNGSGKHLNWSIGDNTGVNYLEPSASPLRNVTLLMTVVAIMLGVQKYGALLRGAVSDAGNDDRLGASEAPPSIMSVYLGDYLSNMLTEIETLSKISEKKMAEISLGIRQLPSVTKDSSDRNRTSPIAYTGNKFEFRSLGSSQNGSELATLINLMVTEGYDLIYGKLEKMKGDPRVNALMVIKDLLKETKKAHFEGNCYTEEWHKEAAKRGLPNIKDTPVALSLMITPEHTHLFTEYQILSERELQARQYIKYRTYIKSKQIEIGIALNMVAGDVLPAILLQLDRVGRGFESVALTGTPSVILKREIEDLDSLYGQIRSQSDSLEKSLIKIDANDELSTVAASIADLSRIQLIRLRNLVDEAETLVSRDIWPFVGYQEIFASIN